jgi:spermidine/putrescine transport system substrate-binding protein
MPDAHIKYIVTGGTDKMPRTRQKSTPARRHTRRSFLKYGTALGSIALAAPMVIRTASAEEKELNWLTYSGHSADEVVGPFKEATGITIRAKEYADGEKMLALIHGSPPGTFDLVTSDAPYVELLAEAGLLQEMNPGDYDMDSFFPEFRNWEQHWFDGKLMALMTSWGYNGLAYNPEKLSAEEVSSYDVMWSDAVKGKLGMRDWYLPVMGCISADMGHKDPYNIDDSQFEALKEHMFSLKPNVAGFWNFAGVFDSLANGGAYVIPGCGDWMTGLLQRANHNIESAVPKEGAIMWTESVSIINETPRLEAAKELVRYLTGVEGQLRLMTKSSYMANGPSEDAWNRLIEVNPEEAKMLHMTEQDDNIMAMLRAGRIIPRRLPKKQSMESWQEAYTQFQNL